MMKIINFKERFTIYKAKMDSEWQDKFREEFLV